jgi:hypothetical protein
MLALLPQASVDLFFFFVEREENTMNRLIRVGIMLILVPLAVGACPPPAFACTPPPGGNPHFTITEHVKASALVVEGVVTGLEWETYTETATIQVIQYIKGSGPAFLAVRGYGPGSVCLTEVYAGMHALFYITIDQTSQLYALQLSQFDAADSADPQNIAEAVAASGQAPSVILPEADIDATLTQAAAITRTITPSLTPSSTPTPYLEMPAPGEKELAVTQAWATLFAAATVYPDDPVGQSRIMTQAAATIQAGYLPASDTPTPLPVSHPPRPVSNASAVGLVGIGIVIGLIVGVIGGLLIGLLIGRRYD